MRLFLPLVFLVPATVAGWHRNPFVRELSVSINGLDHDFFSSVPSRELQSNNGTSCSLCGQYEILNDSFPLYQPENYSFTCADWEQLASALPVGGDCTSLKPLSVGCCLGPPQYRCEQQIRQGRLKDYDTSVPPLEDALGSVNVSVNIIFMTVTDLDVQQGTAEIFVWLEMFWKDPRLAWDIDTYNCSNQISVRASMDSGSTEIWVPDFDLYNVVNGVQNFPDAMAEVFSSGDVYWRRGGSLKAICQYSGLPKIPFDQLGCQFIFGAWTRLDRIKYDLYNVTGFEFGDFTPTYNEFKLLTDLVESSYVYEERALSYVFYFERATNYYLSNMVIPTTILTYVSFGTYLLDFRVGERFAFGVALAFIVVAQQIVTSGLLPISNAALWMDKYISWSFYWVLFGLVESVFIGYILILKEDVVEKDKQKSIDPPEPPSNAEEHSEEFGDMSTASETQQQQPTPTPPPSQAPKRESKSYSVRNLIKNISLRLIDHVCFYFALLSYSIFVLVMFLTVPQWGKNTDPVYE